MTICIAAICTEDTEDYIVFAVDHMLTVGGLGQFEHNIKKYSQLNNTTVGMLAGKTMHTDYFFDNSFDNMSFESISQDLFNKFNLKKEDIIQKEILNKYNIDFNFVHDLLNKPQLNGFSSEIIKAISNIELGVVILLIGFIDGKAKIIEVNDNNIFDVSVLTFHAIGSGHPQAKNALLFQRHSKDDGLRVCLYNVYKAKKNAEVSEGVGKETELGFLSKDGVKILDKSDIEILDKIYNQELNFGKDNELLSDLNI